MEKSNESAIIADYVMNINRQVAPLTGRDSEESEYIHAHTWDRPGGLW